MRGTQLEFGRRVGDLAEPEKSGPCPTRCTRCGQRFSPDGRFCPFDGEGLVPETEWDPRGDPLLDRVVDGRYRIEAVIGEGGMGTVYRVRHVLLDKAFALKALRVDLANDPDIANRFIHEARVIASVSHPGLVQISDFGRLPSGQAYFVMELLGGASLRALLRGGSFTSERARTIARKIAEPIAVAHAAGIVHRDLKPDNVHIQSTEAGEAIKIVDFGLAKVLGGSKLTRDGIIFGTPHYISPEQAAGEAPDQRADIYALGIVLYEMLTGRVPFEADSYMGVLTQHIYMKPRPPSELLGGAAELGALESIVLRCLEKKPERRYASMEELGEALDQAEEACGVSSFVVSPIVDRSLLSVEVSELDSVGIARARTPRTVPALIAVSLVLGSGLVAALLAWTLRAPEPLPPKAPTGRPLISRGVAPAPASSAFSDPPLTEVVASPVAAPATGSSSASARPAAGLPRKLSPKNGATPPRAKLPQRADIIDPWAKGR